MGETGSQAIQAYRVFPSKHNHCYGNCLGGLGWDLQTPWWAEIQLENDQYSLGDKVVNSPEHQGHLFMGSWCFSQVLPWSCMDWSLHFHLPGSAAPAAQAWNPAALGAASPFSRGRFVFHPSRWLMSRAWDWLTPRDLAGLMIREWISWMSELVPQLVIGK